jgi:hypothetical protein
VTGEGLANPQSNLPWQTFTSSAAKKAASANPSSHALSLNISSTGKSPSSALTPTGPTARCCVFTSDYASPIVVDQYESLDSIVEAANEHPENRILVDLAAQTHDSLVRWMDESGVLEAAGDLGMTITYWHVMDSGKDSVELLKKLLDRFGSRLNYVVVLNQLRSENFDILNSSGEREHALALHARFVTLRRLHETVINKIDAGSTSFWAAKNKSSGDVGGLGILERQRVKVWLNHAYEQLDGLYL